MWHRVIQRANHKNCRRNQNSKNEFEFQRYDKELVVGLTQGDLCLCGYDYASKLLANCEILLCVLLFFFVFVFSARSFPKFVILVTFLPYTL